MEHFGIIFVKWDFSLFYQDSTDSSSMNGREPVASPVMAFY